MGNLRVVGIGDVRAGHPAVPRSGRRCGNGLYGADGDLRSQPGTLAARERTAMKAIVYHRYGSPDVLECEEIERPTPEDDQVMIEVRAASVNPFDWHFMRGTPYFMRLIAGLRKPKIAGLGVDVAGRVEAVGRNVARFKRGDEGFGTCRGAFAEYACAPEAELAAKPGNLTFEQAAALPVGALTALQSLRAKGRIQPGQKGLINGAAGGGRGLAGEIAQQVGAQRAGGLRTTEGGAVRV